MTATDRITLVVLNNDGTREKFTLSSWVGIPRKHELMWIGDNIEDFPDLTQDIRQLPDSAFARFGRDYIVLPNPMYGSWETNR